MKRASFVLGFLALMPGGNGWADDHMSHMIITKRTSQPIGHYGYCQKYTSDCRIKSFASPASVLNHKRWNELVAVNKHANAVITPITDLEAYAQEEIWTYPTSYGDCEDYVLMKRHMLMQRGWPASSLLITVVRQANGDGHAVLTVRTNRADYILDNLDDKIRPWSKAPYTFLKRQSRKHSGHWVDIRDDRTNKTSGV